MTCGAGDAASPARPLGVYVHVPWCATRCGYCDFNTYTSAAGRSEYVAAALAELALQRARAGDRRVETVFFGGGTPTLLDPDDLGAILRAIDPAPGAEVTVEANPDSVTPASLARLRELGFTRVSLGMQSGAPHVLRFLGRTHAADRPPAAAREARAAGFEHVSLDLIYGSPVETASDWRATLEAALAAEPDHVSAYGLTVEPGTRLAADVRRGHVPAPDPDVMADRHALADELLAGLGWYEVSNWGEPCRHNRNYWLGGDWLAIGPGAHGHLDGRRWWNVKHPAEWAARAATGAIAGEETLSATERLTERIMLELRTREGLDIDLCDPAALDDLRADGLVEVRPRRAVLTLRGRLLADHAARRLIPAPVAA